MIDQSGPHGRSPTDDESARTRLPAYRQTEITLSAPHPKPPPSPRPGPSPGALGLLALSISGFWLLVFYPGAMSVDGMMQWEQARDDIYYNWHPPFLALLMRASQTLADGPWLLGLIQGTAFWFAAFYLLAQLFATRVAFWSTVAATALLPPLWLYSNALISNTWASLCVLLALAFLLRAQRVPAAGGKWGALMVLSLAMAVAFRRESILVAAALILLYLSTAHRGRWGPRKLALGLALGVATLIPQRLVELHPDIRTLDHPAAHGVFNQYVGTMVNARHSMEARAVDAERTAVDAEFGEGTFDTLLEAYRCYSGDYILVHRHVPAVIGRNRLSLEFAASKTVSAALHHPIAWLKHVRCYLWRLAQGPQLTYQGWGVVDDDPGVVALRNRNGLQWDSRLPAVRAAYASLMGRLLEDPVLSVLFKHWVFLLILLAGFAVGVATRDAPLFAVGLAGLSYPIGYLVAGPSTLWRYLMPSYLCGWITLFLLVGWIIDRRTRRGSALPTGTVRTLPVPRPSDQGRRPIAAADSHRG